jgi:phospholipase D1/2
MAIAVVRLLPIAPFSIVNAVAGASRIRLREFLLGTLLGMLPGITATVIFVDRVAAAVTDPGLDTFLMLAGFAALIIAIALFVHKRLVKGNGAAAVGGKG